MTNLLATIIVTLATNWVTISRTTPVIPNGTQLNAVYITDTLNQQGHIVTNYFLQLTWKGEPKQFLLESIPIQNQPPLHRSIPDDHSNMFNLNTLVIP